jgi:hypothetical protein
MPMDKGILQAYLDGELSKEQMEEVRVHLDCCLLCRNLLEELSQDNGFARENLTRYEKAHQTMPVNVHLAWERFVKSSPTASSNQSKGRIFMITKYRKTTIAAGLLLALGISLLFQPVRTLATQFLSIFRVERMQTISISPEQLDQFSAIFKKNRGSLRIRNFGEISITGTMKSNRITKAEALREIPQAVIPETLPGGFGIQNIGMNSANVVRLKLKLANVNDLLQSVGATRLLPAELDGKTFEIRIPAMLGIEYRVNQKYLELIETISPELSVPEGAQADAIREAILQLPFLPPELASQLRAINDWQHTLVIPNSEGNAEQIFIGGNSGIYFSVAKNMAILQKFFPEGESQLKSAHNSFPVNDFTGAAAWEINGRVYLLCGNVDKTTLISLAGSIR